MALDEREQDRMDLLVHAYVDGELDVTSGLAVERRIETEPSVADQAADIRALQATLRSRFPRQPLPFHLRSRIAGLENRSVVARRPTWALMAASLVLAVALSSTSTWLALHPSASSIETRELIDGHLRSLAATQPIDIASSDRHTVKPWFNGKVAYSPQVKDISEAGYPLLGGRVDVFNKITVPTLVYNRRRHVISVTAIAASGEAGHAESSVNGFNIIRWIDDGISYWAISDLNSAELNEFVKLYRQSP